MTSAIVSGTIDADFPVAGQDNDSQGFRDNFQIIKDGLATAASEVTVLQNSTAKVDANNNFNGNDIDNARTNRLYGKVYDIPASLPTNNISLNNGEYQSVTLTGSHTLTFTDWPDSERYAKVRLQLKGDGNGSWIVTFATEGGGNLVREVTQALAQATEASRNPSTGSVTSTKFSFPTANISGSFGINDTLYGTNLSGTVTVASIVNKTMTATATTTATTIGYTAIGLNAVVTTSGSTAGLSVGAKVRLSDVGSMTGIATGVDYFVFAINAGDFRLAGSLVDAQAGNPLTGLGGAPFSGVATATFPELDPSSNAVTVDNSSSLYVGMPIKFTGTSFGGITSNTEYYVLKIISGTAIRLSATLNGSALPLSTASGTLTMIPTSILTANHTSQTVTSLSNLTLNTAYTTFIVSQDASRVKFVEAWTADGGDNVFLKYLGEFR